MVLALQVKCSRCFCVLQLNSHGCVLLFECSELAFHLKLINPSLIDSSKLLDPLLNLLAEMHNNSIVSRLRNKSFALLVGLDELNVIVLSLIDLVHKTDVLSDLSNLLHCVLSG